VFRVHRPPGWEEKRVFLEDEKGVGAHLVGGAHLGDLGEVAFLHGGTDGVEEVDEGEGAFIGEVVRVQLVGGFVVGVVVVGVGCVGVGGGAVRGTAVLRQRLKKRPRHRPRRLPSN